jgi:hypothetical protein
MNIEDQIIAVEKGIKNLKNYIKNADHTQHVTFDMIFADELTEEELAHILDVTDGFESFAELDGDENEEDALLTPDMLAAMLYDLESVKEEE